MCVCVCVRVCVRQLSKTSARGLVYFRVFDLLLVSCVCARTSIVKDGDRKRLGHELAQLWRHGDKAHSTQPQAVNAD